MPVPRRDAFAWFFGLGLAAFGIVLLANAWVVDDAYITFRTIDNFVHGHGLTWNIDERVQTYTHPLWMMVMTVFYAFTGEAFYTSVALNFALTLAAAILAAFHITRGFAAERWKALLLLLA